MDIVSFKIDEIIRNKIIEFYKDHQMENNGDYIDFFAKYENTTITIFSSKKGYKVVFNGPLALEESRIFNPDAALNTPKEKTITNFLTYKPQIGSDEVGFGDFFGPLVVVACYFDESLFNQIGSIDDSKKITDKHILEFIPTILDKVTFSKLTVRNEKFNEMISKGYNMTELKSKLHNRALNNVKEKYPQVKDVFIDQFVSPDIYYSYIAFEDKTLDNITFKTKAESFYPSVALASMIARYCFLKEMEVLSNKYKMEFPKGAGKSVDEFAKEFLKRYGIDEFKNVAKLNFANYKQLIE